MSCCQRRRHRKIACHREAINTSSLTANYLAFASVTSLPPLKLVGVARFFPSVPACISKVRSHTLSLICETRLLR